MSRTLTLDDLAGGESESSGGSDSGGEWITDLVDKLDDKGMLEPFIMQMTGIDPTAGEAPESVERTEPSGDSGGVEMDSEKIKGLLLQVYDNASMIPGLSDDPTLSELIKLIDGNPEQVNELIEKNL